MNYSEFIIVDYEGGYGGDFFCSILYKNFTQNYNLQYHNENTDLLNNHINYPLHFGNIKNFRQLLVCLSSMWDGTFGEKKLDQRLPSIQNVLNVVYDDDYESAVDNIIGLCRSFYDIGKPKIWAVHYLENPKHFENFTMDMVFPKSKKIRLICKDVKYHILFCMLGAFKRSAVVVDYDTAPEKASYELKHHNLPVRPSLFTKEFEPYVNFQDFHDVDVGMLFFGEDDQVQVIEQQLTNIVGKQIKLDRHWLKKYKQKNIAILEHMLGHELNIDAVDTNLDDFKNYFIRANKYYVE